MMQVKEKKEMDDAFKKAQKPWAKLLAKVLGLKDYAISRLQMRFYYCMGFFFISR